MLFTKLQSQVKEPVWAGFVGAFDNEDNAIMAF